ncbi:MAG: hypothetical protein M0R77_12860 [Gammaproteobacteria bacterium]|nr:hypothetical protein [Gammaproteobacteria bacterium]
MFLAFESPIVGDHRQPTIKHLIGPTNINVDKFYGPFGDRMEVDTYAEGQLAAGCKCDIVVVPLADTKSKLERIVELLREADCLQQEIATDTSSDGFCYKTHNQLEDLADSFEAMIVAVGDE